MKRPRITGPGLYDPTDVMNRAQMNYYTREGFIKLGFYVVSFLVYLYKYVHEIFNLLSLISSHSSQHDGSTSDGSYLTSRLLLIHTISKLSLPSLVTTRHYECL